MRLAILLALLHGLLTAGAQGHAREVVFATTHYPPYSSTHDPQGGAMVRLVQELLKPLGYTVKVSPLPWQRLLQDRARYDGILVLWPNEATDLGLVGYQGVFKSRLGFFTRTDTPIDVSSIAGLGKRAVGATRGYGYPALLLESALRIEYVADDLSNLRKLHARRFDLVALERVVGEYWIRQHPELRSVQWNEPAMAEIPLGFAVVPGRPGASTLARDLEDGLRQHKARGDMGRLTKAYALDPMDPEHKRRAAPQ